MNNKRKFFLYARKSSEWDERQVQSLDDQVNIMKKKAKDLWIEIVEILQEAMSAKSPWRYKFNEMIGRIQNWEAEGIIAWKVDRLTRNPIDTWTIQFMLQNWTLSKIITTDRDYNPVDAWLLFSVETGMANQYILDLRKNVIRWMNSKTEKGWFCWQAPEGYLNDRLEKTIIVDEDNFPLIRKVWELMLTWNYSVPQVLDVANNNLWYKSNKKWRNKLTQSGMYGILSNPFYTGDFLWKWEIKKGIHTPMITWEEFERVQKLIGDKGNSIRAKSKEFAYTAMMKCWECGCSIVAEEKTKYVKTTGEMKSYSYYRCSKRSNGCTCKQKPINLTKLEEQINDILENIEILPEFRKWWLEVLKDEFHSIRIEREKVVESVEREEKALDKKLSTLLDYLMDETITREDYQVRSTKTKEELHTKKKQLEKLRSDKDTSIEYTEDLCDLIVNVTEKFNTGSLKDKKMIFSFLGENFHLQDGVLALELHPWLLPLIKQVPIIKRKYRALEP